MSTSTGVSPAADEGLAAAGRGDTAGAQAAIVVVCREPVAREILHRELSNRYGADYRIVVCGRPAELASWMRDLRAAGWPVALVIAAVGAQDRDGIEVLAAVRAVDPTALRGAAVGWGDWQSRRSVFDAVAVGEIGVITPKASAISALEGLTSTGRSAPNRSATAGRSPGCRPSSSSSCRPRSEAAS